MKHPQGTVDQKLMFMLAALMGIGLVLVFSSTSVTNLTVHKDKFFAVKSQMTWICVGLVGMMFTLNTDYHKLRAFSIPGLLLAIFFLILVLVPGVGREVHGATRWIVITERLRFQPSEITKLAVILYLADALSRNYKKRESFLDYLLPNVLLLGTIALMVVKQKALSSAILIVSTGFLMIVIAYSNLGHIVTMCLLGLSGVAAAIVLEPYRMRRWIAFLNPWGDAEGSGYQIIQSLMALGTGGVTGVGIGQGLQKIKYLPFVETDFIFAVLGEEMGLIGILVVIALFLGVLYRGISIALRAPDLFGMFLAFGITTAIVVQALLNMMVVTGLMPTTGIPLPFISYGGNSMVYMLASVGILLNISRAADRDTMSKMSRRWAQA